MIDNRRKAPDSFMPLWIADYLADTGHLTTEQDGAYLHLLMGYWRRKCVGLPDDDAFLCQLTKLSKHKWRFIRPIVGAFFEIRDGVWRNNRADAEWAKAIKLKDAKSAAGTKGAEATNAKRAGRATYTPPHSVAKSYENSQGGDVAMSPKNSEGDIGTKSAELSHVNHGTAAAMPSANGSANERPTPSPLLEPSSEKIDRKDSLVVRTEREPTPRPASKPISSKAERGTRWPSGQLVPGEWIAAAAHKRAERGLPIIDLGLEAEKFSNFWTAKAGRDATKVDWSATWRNWALNAYGAKANGKGQFGNGRAISEHPLGIFGQLGDELRDRALSGSGGPEDHGGIAH